MKRLFKNKVLAFVIALMMIASTFPMGIFSVSATTVQGEAIVDADGFARMEPNGTYYLAKSITLTETYATKFTGKFNGNGYTIKVSAPIFDQVMDATIENFKVVSQDNAVVTLADGGGMVCNKAGGNTILRNITNTVSLQSTNSTTNHSLAGIVGDFAAGAENSTVTIEGCVNEGIITADESKGVAGGIVGGGNIEEGAYNVIVENCINSGKIDGAKCGGVIALFDKLSGTVTLRNCRNSGFVEAKLDLAGGIIGQVTSSISLLRIYNCENTNGVKTPNKRCGGIIAICQIGSASEKVLISDCFNGGAITSTNSKGSCGGIAGVLNGVIMERCGNSGLITASDNAGGIIGSASTGSDGSTIKYCYNTGAATASRVRAAGIVADANNSATIITGCYNKGTITGKRAYESGEIFGKTIIPGIICDETVSSPTGKSDQITNNYVKVETTYATGYDADEDLASGALALAMNTAIGKTVYYQNVNEGGATRDDNPVLDPTHGHVFKNDGKFYSLAFYTLETASIKLEVEKAMRFSTAVNKADYDFLTTAENGPKLTFNLGTLITPDAYLEIAEKDFTVEGLENLAFESNPDAKAYLNVTASGFMDLRETEENDPYYYFHGSIANIKAQNYKWDYSAIGYVTVGEATIYSSQYATRNLEYVVNAAKNDPASYTADEYSIIESYLVND